MKKSERCIVYSALIALAALNAVFLLSSSGRTAFAEASAWLADLGPADSLKLVDGEKEIAVRNKAGRLAWGDGDFKQSYAIGFVDISKALNPLMETQSYADEREALKSELETVENDYKAKLDAFGEELQGMDQQSPQYQEKLTQARTLYQEYMKWGQDAMGKRNELDVKHLQQAYREMASAVNVVADKMGVDIVLRFIPTDKDFKAVDAEQALTEIRLRSAVKYPEKLDITSEVLEELSLQDSDH
jgi:Skp family chaperone for outer membrane proteins